MTLKITILGCGSSGGVPRIGGIWGACDPNNPKNRRRRSGLLVQKMGPDGETAVLIDTSADLREQLLQTNVATVDGVFFTHEHADHVHGIDDLRAVAFNRHRAGKGRVDVYMSAQTAQNIKPRFSYCFETPPGGDYPPILNAKDIVPFTPLFVAGEGGTIEALPLPQFHGKIQSMGFRFGNFAFCTDLHGFPDESLAALQGLDCLVLDALRYEPHVSHLSVAESLTLIKQLRPKRAYLTNLHIDLDYDRLNAETPAHVEPAFDGLEITASFS